MKLINKSMLTAIITLSTASVYYAQQVRDTAASSKDIEEVVLTGVADLAKDRKTPVAVSTIKEAQIQERLGNQEFPEVLAYTPSVYATKGGGGFGDGRMNVRGFDTNNTAVMINGVPVNDMENGSVYWSNWMGLSDVTSAMQIQRGLGASKLAIASVGGTVNIITRAADKRREGNVTVGLGNDGYHKALFSYNTGKSDKGWSASFLMSRTAGAMYIDGSDFEAYNYYFALGFQPNKKHDFQFTFTGAPQWHNQNFTNTIETYLKYGKDGEPNRRYNSNWGFLNGDQFSTNTNYYSKPVASINWDWNISSKSKLSTVGYGSWGRGGGTGFLGNINGTSIFSLPKTADGQIRWDDIVAWNQGQQVIWNPAQPTANINKVNATPGIATRSNGLVRRAHVNSHDWYGILSNFQHKVNENWNFQVGIDGRYYYGYHPGVITDFLGNNEYRENQNLNLQPFYSVTDSQNATPSANPFAKAVKDKSQIASRNYDGQVRWLGAFGQVEYSNDVISAFIQGSFSSQGYQRIDNWIIDGVTRQPNVPTGQVVYRKTGYNNFTGYNVKGGANYNINENHNVFVNAGYYSKQPQFSSVYVDNQQVLNPNATNEKIGSVELGYGFRNLSGLRANVNLYYTSWDDRFLRIGGIPLASGDNGYANMLGVKQVHMGAEFEASYKVNEYIDLTGMFSYGDWRYKNNPTGNFFDNNNQPVNNANGSNEITLALDDVKVSDAAQTTAALGITVHPVKQMNVYANWRYAGRLYSQISINRNYEIVNGVVPDAAKKGALELPSYNIFDLGASYAFNLRNNNKLILSANVYNLLDTVYISEGRNSIHADDIPTRLQDGTVNSQKLSYQQLGYMYNGVATANQVYFGTGTTWAASISYRF
ncbi:TonB-dependent receptor [Chryseobacterium echinoideorum]|uniref:TonB-dependent receptor n=1 Tax=Chryseobacterium echinoideorum TaxID=1549648 RepID=UPI001186534F|nr:TonB-dependent receptor plug domain-containing protein [Chryseobacterium echinoideorum]